jgi:UDPglucose 6-dehydrogenase
MKIGIIGLGIVGKAMQVGFEKLDYVVKIHDIILDTNISDVLDTDIVYVCVPTPSAKDGSCDTSIVEQVVTELKEFNYPNIIAIKSTCIPGTTQKLIDRYNDKILFVPEFLKERSAEYDFIHNHNLLCIGSNNVNHAYIAEISHGTYPKQVIRVTPTEAELVKYMHNSFGAMRVNFANEYFELCEKLNQNYDTVKRVFIAKNKLPDEYLDVKPELRGFGGACLPKDMRAINKFMQQELGLPYKLWETILEDNDKFRRTAFKGMRSN